ncbi:trace amine-associated receptor 1-like [Lepisosteus oculatus]|uniref:trace amine-associated receptor 1-like n=1 Tax=Lepisosteus oculatus TaxID=7918 RepID=UPI0035F5011D
MDCTMSFSGTITIGEMGSSVRQNFNFTENSDIHFCFESIAGSCTRIIKPVILRFVLYFIMVLIILTTLCGNFVVMISIAFFKQLHTNTNYLILSLAVCDFLLGVLIMPYTMIFAIEGCWYLGSLFCQIHTATDMMLSTASIFHLCSISIDRYFAVCNPLSYRTKITSGVILLMIIISWVVSGLFGFTIVFLKLNIKGIEVFYYKYIDCVGGCIVFFSKYSGPLCSLFSYFIPAFIMLGIYFKIYLVARKQAKSIKDITQQIQESKENKVGVSSQQERKAAKTLGIVVGVFAFLWTPFFVFIFSNPILEYTVPPILIDTAFWFGYLNSACNPIIYAFFYTWFRKATKIIISGKIFEKDSCWAKLIAE